jgi:hypothetical protein
MEGNMVYIMIGLGLFLTIFGCIIYFKRTVSNEQNNECSNSKQQTENTEQSNHKYKCDGDKCVIVHHE